ncbi:GIY-YIG nuclease family protein [Sulfurimonas sp.]
MAYFVYIVKCIDETLYTGIATDVERRIYEHNHSDKGAKYTRNRRPVELLYSEECKDRSSASKREYIIKKFSRLKKLKLIQETTHSLHTNKIN